MGLSHMDLLSLRQLHIPLWKGKDNYSAVHHSVKVQNGYR